MKVGWKKSKNYWVYECLNKNNKSFGMFQKFNNYYLDI